MEFPSEDFLSFKEGFCDLFIRNGDHKLDNFGNDFADIAPDRGLGVVLTRVPIETRSTDVVTANQLHDVRLDLVTPKAAHMHMHLVQAGIELCIVGVSFSEAVPQL